MNNDLISRKWLTDAIRNRKTYLSYEDAKDVIDLIDNAPTVTDNEPTLNECVAFNNGYNLGKQEGYKIGKSERPQGEWIMQRHDLDGCFYTCSNCGRMIRVSLFTDDPEDNETLADYPYCHCGADMRKGGAE